jgi:hypothetical protein
VSKGFWNALSDLSIKEAWIAAPVKEPYLIAKGVTVASPTAVIKALAARPKKPR